MRKEQSTLVVTVIDESGAKQFRITKFIRKLVLYGSVMFIIFGIVEYFIMNSTIYKLGHINEAKKQAVINYKNLHHQNASLRTKIEDKSRKLKLLNDKISDLESVVSMGSKSNTHTKAGPVDIGSISDTQKSVMLKIFPNLDPVRIFDERTKALHSKSDSTLRSLGYRLTRKVVNAGYDYYTSKREPVVATADSIVEFTRRNHRYGNVIRLVHALGFNSNYAHLEQVVVKKGDFVKKGDIIGYTTPRSSSSTTSLYYEVRFMGASIDTLSFINWSEHNFSSIFSSEDNSVIDFNTLIWAINDIVKLKEMSTNYWDTSNGDENKPEEAQDGD